MTDNDKVEAFLIECGIPYDFVKEGFWIIHEDDESVDNIVVVHTPPVITFRVKLMELPAEEIRAELFGHLLKLNATSMVAGASGLEDNAVVIVDSLQSENLDLNEFQASIDGLFMAMREHYPELKRFVATSAAN
jgi:hypothetical protein